MIVAGEASGDLHGSRVVQAIMRLNPEIQVFAMGSTHLRQAGAEIIIDSSRLAVVGITEVFEHIRGLFRAYQNLKEFIKNNKLSLAILIDFPDFNLFLARVAKKAGVPVLYYIGPQVWAWRSGRVQKIVRRVNKMAVIFPFPSPGPRIIHPCHSQDIADLHPLVPYHFNPSLLKQSLSGIRLAVKLMVPRNGKDSQWSGKPFYLREHKFRIRAISFNNIAE